MSISVMMFQRFGVYTHLLWTYFASVAHGELLVATNVRSYINSAEKQ